MPSSSPQARRPASEHYGAVEEAQSTEHGPPVRSRRTSALLERLLANSRYLPGCRPSPGHPPGAALHSTVDRLHATGAVEISIVRARQPAEATVRTSVRGGDEEEHDATVLARSCSWWSDSWPRRCSLRRLRWPRPAPGPEASLLQKAAQAGKVQIVAQIKARQGPAVAEIARSAGGTDVRTFELMPYVTLTGTAATLRALAANANVVRITEDIPRPPTLNSSLPVINADDVRALGFTGEGRTVAILDTGIDADHPFFRDNNGGNPGTSRILSLACFSDPDNGANQGPPSAPTAPRPTSPTPTSTGWPTASTAGRTCAPTAPTSPASPPVTVPVSAGAHRRGGTRRRASSPSRCSPASPTGPADCDGRALRAHLPSRTRSPA